VPKVSGVDAVVDFGQYQELRLEQGVDPQRVLADLMTVGRVELFEIAHPSLQDIFVRIASPDRESMAGAA